MQHDYMKRISKKPFRLWLQKQWQEHKIEREYVNDPVDYTLEDYFQQHKKFLIKKFKEHHRS